MGTESILVPAGSITASTSTIVSLLKFEKFLPYFGVTRNRSLVILADNHIVVTGDNRSASSCLLIDNIHLFFKLRCGERLPYE